MLYHSNKLLMKLLKETLIYSPHVAGSVKWQLLRKISQRLS
jgi:hypothetical protein